MATTTHDDETHSVPIGYLCWALGFFGNFGAHRFYYGRPITGIIWSLTFGLLLIGWIIDFFLIPGMDEKADGEYTRGPFDYTIAWALLSFPLSGVFGLHRFYLGKWITGIIWLLTGGLFLVGFFYDLCTLNEQVDAKNRDAVGAA
ncbi:TM2 domain-containing protein [Stratiformator vulcanicus]|uniref:TM2 domain protein n=1 Tax=Stratiformator vulcanicus TaxID=2527980 RepID=A0A517R5U4_9PLAN|nr:TM2 domain-containing protein [Stratiformator vulcanicus]QDT39205.1 TM2 domain protein [Stratiformator vulcanicus]